jgi:hypothetical protein
VRATFVTAWALWLIVVGVVLLVRRTDPLPVARPAIASC